MLRVRQQRVGERDRTGRGEGGVHQEIWKALQVQKAFQQVLDTPGAEKALTHLALKPLLDHAAK